jgi:hypothetical protein
VNEADAKVLEEMFSGKPIPPDAPCGWQERMDALHLRPGKPMPGPWHWEIHDHSMASLAGGGEDSMIAHVLSVSPCGACESRADPKEWEWGRCMTPSAANARLIAAAPDMLAALWEILAATVNNKTVPESARAAVRMAISKATAE